MIVTICFLLLVTPHLGWSEEAAARARASLPEVEFDFGRVTQGTVVKHDFVIKNTGTAPLRIENIVPSCGCTATSATTELIDPGAEGKIHVEFDTDGFSGKKLKSVKVHVNDFDEPTILLSVSGYIEEDIQVKPARLFFGDLRKGESKSEEMTVTVRDGANVNITEISSNSPNVTLNFLEKTPKKYRFTATLGADSKIGELRSRLLVKFTTDSERSINIPVYASVKGLIEISPSSLSFGVIEGEGLMKRSAKLVNYSPDPIRIKDVLSSDSAVKASYKTIKEGNAYVIDVSVNPKQVKTNLRALVTVLTDNQEQKELTLNVYGAIPPVVR